MSSIKHDNAGFLIGDLIESSNTLLKSQQAGLSLTRAIRADVSAIARAMGVSARSNVPGRTNRVVAEPAGRAGVNGATGQRASGRLGGVAVARGRGADGRFAASGTVNRSAIKKIATETNKAQAVDGARDNRGRFAGGGSEAENDRSGVGGMLADKIGKFTDAFKGMAQSGENIDPAITAMGEIKSVLEPFGRGAFALFGRNGEKKKERWQQKIWKSLTNIEKKPTGSVVVGGASSGGGINIGLGGLLKGGGGLFKGAGGLLGRLLKGGGGALKGAGGLLKRIPILGALLAGGGALASMFGSDDPSKSADENRTEKYKGAGGSIGMGIGGVAGAALGSLLGPVGTVVGGYLGSMGGEIIGEKVGEWTKTLVDADIPGKIGKAWDGFIDVAKDRWKAMKGGADALWTDAKNLAKKGVDKAVDLGNKANDAVKSATGIDVKKTAQETAAKMSDAAVSAKAGAVAAGDFVAENAPKLVPNTIKRLVESVGRDSGKVVGAVVGVGAQAKAGYDVARGTPTDAPAPSGAVQSLARGAGGAVGKGAAALNRWTGGARDDLTNASVTAGVDPGLVAQISNFESGFNSSATPTRKDGSKISSAHGYGQFLDGTWTDMVNKYGGKYGVEGAGKLSKDQAGTLRNDPKLQASMLAEFTKENVIKGRAMGGSDDAANVYAYHNLGDGDAKRMLGALKTNPEMSARDALIGGRNINEKERARIESVISGNKSLYGDGTISASAAYGRMGSKMREGEGYAADARALASGGLQVGQNLGVRTAVPTVSVNPPVLAQSSVPSSVPSKIPSAPEITMPAPAAPEKDRTVVVASNSPVGQNMPDRTIAHIASGGLGSTGRW